MLGQNDPEPWQPKRAMLELSVYALRNETTEHISHFPNKMYCTALLKA